MQNIQLSSKQKKLAQIIKFIKQEVEKAGLTKAVVAVSGGVDSAVALACTVNAIGPNNVRAITLPEVKITPQNDVEDVIYLCNQYGITCDQIDITPILRVISTEIPRYNEADYLANGNIKARLRMLITYYYANIEKALVVGTSNKTEYYLGYYTKYGDGGVDIMPFADLYKHQVRDLARYLGIKESIANKQASARLWAGQVTENELGMDYDSLDLLVHLALQGKSAEDISETLSKDLQMISKLLNRIEKNRHKREPPAVLRLG